MRQCCPVITSPRDDVLLSNLGWVDKGAIWRLDGATQTHDLVPVDGGTHLRLAAGDGVDSVLVQHGVSGRVSLSVRSWSGLADPLVAVDVHGWTAHVDGELGAFRGHRRLFVGYLDDDATGAAGYFLVEVGKDDVSVRRLDWFSLDTYDLGYQSVVSALELPNGEYLFGVQRSSKLVLCDPTDLSVIREVPLAGRGGNPMPFLRANGSELWAVDYDTVVRLDATSLTVEDRWLGQVPRHDGVRMFLGDVWMSHDEDELVVARPGSGDVVSLDPESVRVVRRWRTAGQPLTAAKLANQLVARDWQAGDLLVPYAED